MVLSDTAIAFSALGETSQLTATLKDQNGNDISGTAATWTTAELFVVVPSPNFAEEFLFKPRVIE
tara:strand:- start:307 stop:501 length:195 start_codon:yes stop_codon:yes gene_type:complete